MAIDIVIDTTDFSESNSFPDRVRLAPGVRVNHDTDPKSITGALELGNGTGASFVLRSVVPFTLKDTEVDAIFTAGAISDWVTLGTRIRKEAFAKAKADGTLERAYYKLG